MSTGPALYQTQMQNALCDTSSLVDINYTFLTLVIVAAAAPTAAAAARHRRAIPLGAPPPAAVPSSGRSPSAAQGQVQDHGRGLLKAHGPAAGSRVAGRRRGGGSARLNSVHRSTCSGDSREGLGGAGNGRAQHARGDEGCHRDPAQAEDRVDVHDRGGCARWYEAVRAGGGGGDARARAASRCLHCSACAE